MRSWIFRHRLRLRAIYAARPALPPAPRALENRRSGRGPVIVVRRGPHTILRPGVPRSVRRLRPVSRSRQKPAA